MHPTSTLVVGVVSTALFSALTLLAQTTARPDQRSVSYFFAAFLLMSVPVIVEGVRVRHELTAEGIGYRGMWVQHSLVSWGELESAHWNHWMKWLTLTTRDGRTLRFSGLLNGLETLAMALKECAPTLHTDDETAQMLADAREGRLPSVWG